VLSFLAHVLGKLVALTAMMDRLDRLFEHDGDEEAEDDGGDVDKEFAPVAGGVMGRVNVEHGGWSLWNLQTLRRLDWNWRLLCMRRRRGRQDCRIGRVI
jgi:hypothetical protein